jgi:hypothetical protein
MAFDVTQFRSNLPGDGARSNLFEVTLQFPNWLTNSVLAGQKSQFLVKAAQLPGSSIGIAPLFYFGREVKLAGNRTFQDWTVQIINDEDFVIRNTMEAWMNGINGPITNIRNTNATVLDGGYGVDSSVNQLGKTGAVLKTYQFLGIWPIDLSPIELDWGSNDQIEEFTVTFAVQNYIDPTVDQQ